MALRGLNPIIQQRVIGMRLLISKTSTGGAASKGSPSDLFFEKSNLCRTLCILFFILMIHLFFY